MDSYNFVPDTEPYTPLDITPEHDAKYFDYLDKHYSLFDNDGLIYMRKLTDNDIANHIKEINNDVTRVNFDANYSYQRKQMVVNKFDSIFQGIIDADPSCTFPLSQYFLMDWYTGWFCNCTDAQEQIDSIVMTVDPYIELSTLRDMIGDRLVSSLTAKGLQFWQQQCELQFAHEEATEHNIDIAKFTTPHKINDEINRLHLKYLYTAKNVIISLYDLNSKILREDALNIYSEDFHTWINNTGAIDLSVWINRSKPMIYNSMKKAQLDDTHPFWSTHKQTNRFAQKPRADNYKEFLSRKTIHINADNTPLVDKLTRYSPAPPPRSFTLYDIPDRFCRRLADFPPQSFPMFLIPDRLVIFPPSPGIFFVSILVLRWRKDPGGRVISTIVCGGICF